MGIYNFQIIDIKYRSALNNVLLSQNNWVDLRYKSAGCTLYLQKNMENIAILSSFI